MAELTEKQACGIVMPISAIDGCGESHWADVLEIISESIDTAGFVGNLVSNADEVGIIHKRIIQNLYDNPVVVCDVSGKNPNVMFELGLRLAFDKPTVIVKDDKTAYSFDTSAIEHLEYPRDLRFSRIVDFKQKLADKIVATHKRATTDPNYTTFLKHFGEFTVAKLDKKEVSGQEFILEELRSIQLAIRRIDSRHSMPAREYDGHYKHVNWNDADIDLCLEKFSPARRNYMLKSVKSNPDVSSFRIVDAGEDHQHLLVEVKPGSDADDVRRSLDVPVTRKTREVKSGSGLL